MMIEQALFLDGIRSGAMEARVAAVLKFFGVSLRQSTIADLEAEREEALDAPRYRLFCSAETLAGWLRSFRESSCAATTWRQRVHSVFVAGSGDPAALEELVRALSGDSNVRIGESRAGEPEVSVNKNLTEFCGAMAGVTCKLADRARPFAAEITGTNGSCKSIIHHRDGSVFFRIDYCGVPVFISTAVDIVDLNAPLMAPNFDVRRHFLTAVPIVLYVRWAFPGTAWRSPETSACLIIDDPLLKPRYGFLNYGKLLALMERQRFSTNIAFIPWNWRRNDQGVVQLFRSHRDRYSISVHGCDHTAAEFGTTDPERMQWQIAQALDRMERHHGLTGLDHDSVMVFPQGVFSTTAVSALKHNGFRAIVNTGAMSVDRCEHPITIGDVWGVAVLNYDGFPLFTRRYPSQGVENFAFDALLGKPCLVVIHHDFLRDGARDLEEFIGRLIGLNWRLTWRSLGEALRRSYRERNAGPHSFEVQMYGTDLVIENSSGFSTQYLFRRKEPDPMAVETVGVNSSAVGWTDDAEGIQFEFQLRSAQSGEVAIRYRTAPSIDTRSYDSLKLRMASCARRYACEIRDNLVVPGRHFMRSYEGAIRRHLRS